MPPPPENMVVAGTVAQLLPDGTAAAPADAPVAVQQAIWAANKLQDKPYKYGGGHAKIEDTGYDCSGTVSYALIAAGLLAVAASLRPVHALGREGPRRVDHRLRARRPRLRGHRRPAAGHQRRTPRAPPAQAQGTPARPSSAVPAGGPRMRPSRGFRARHPLGL